jgi:hypothetical protein
MDSFFAPLRSTKSNLLPPGNCPSRPLGYPSDVRRRGSLCAVLLIRPPRTVRRLALTIDPVLAVLEVEKSLACVQVRYGVSSTHCFTALSLLDSALSKSWAR